MTDAGLLRATAVREFLAEHKDLVLKHARAHVRKAAELIRAEDVAREMELELAQLAQHKGLDPAAIASPDALLRAMVKHATGRAKRRRKLVEQIAAGDDLQAVSEDLASLDADLSDTGAGEGDAARAARAALDKVKSKLTPRDALIFALLFEDELTGAEVGAALVIADDAIENARARILELAARELPPEGAL
jgi:DNA-directed RNA polymerase specialized sigma24 family protein